ncbi:polygalacturonase-like [Cucurbita maxima]|uniref:Polygalacturonase-like n=1 Tax=Cucurbita maxima TaxID=3661 RepID=A0A6J1IDK3_CUCMA|nr:polygalacturonase-like [Cucurbita maxima]
MTWAKACDSSTPATIYVPQGIFYVRSVSFNGPCKNNVITVLIDGTLVASSEIQVLAKTKSWIEFSHIDELSITGGIINGQETALWNCKHLGKRCPIGATSIQINDAQNVNINGLSSINSQKFNMVHGFQNVHMTRVNVSSIDDSPNTDGIHEQQSSDVTILNSSISNGDDYISISPGTSNLWMESIICGPGHGTSIGSLGIKAEEDGVHNVTLTLSTFSRTHNGASGVKVIEVTYEDIKGTSATEIPINFDCSPINHCTKLGLKDINLTYENHIAKASYTVRNDIGRHSCWIRALALPKLFTRAFTVVSGPSACWVPMVMASRVKGLEVTYEEIKGTSATEIAINFDCSPINHCTGLSLKDINLITRITSLKLHVKMPKELPLVWLNLLVA